jgi:hypothetical protein
MPEKDSHGAIHCASMKVVEMLQKYGCHILGAEMDVLIHDLVLSGHDIVLRGRLDILVYHPEYGVVVVDIKSYPDIKSLDVIADLESELTPASESSNKDHYLKNVTKSKIGHTGTFPQTIKFLKLKHVQQLTLYSMGVREALSTLPEDSPFKNCPCNKIMLMGLDLRCNKCEGYLLDASNKKILVKGSKIQTVYAPQCLKNNCACVKPPEPGKEKINYDTGNPLSNVKFRGEKNV